MAKLTITDYGILEAALAGLQHLLGEVNGKIAELHRRLRGKGSANGTATRGSNLSTEARQRIAAAQKKRWAAYRKSRKKVG